MIDPERRQIKPAIGTVRIRYAGARAVGPDACAVREIAGARVAGCAAVIASGAGHVIIDAFADRDRRAKRSPGSRHKMANYRSASGCAGGEETAKSFVARRSGVARVAANDDAAIGVGGFVREDVAEREGHSGGRLGLVASLGEEVEASVVGDARPGARRAIGGRRLAAHDPAGDTAGEQVELRRGRKLPGP